MTTDEIFLKRVKQSVSQTELAKLLGWNASTVIDIEKGRVPVSDEALDRMAQAIDKLAPREAVTTSP